MLLVQRSLTSKPMACKLFGCRKISVTKEDQRIKVKGRSLAELSIISGFALYSTLCSLSLCGKKQRERLCALCVSVAKKQREILRALRVSVAKKYDKNNRIKIH